MSYTEIVSEALELPLSDRLQIVNELVESFNPMKPDVEEKWEEELMERHRLFESGKIQTVSYEEVFGEG